MFLQFSQSIHTCGFNYRWPQTAQQIHPSRGSHNVIGTAPSNRILKCENLKKQNTEYIEQVNEKVWHAHTYPQAAAINLSSASQSRAVLVRGETSDDLSNVPLEHTEMGTKTFIGGLMLQHCLCLHYSHKWTSGTLVISHKKFLYSQNIFTSWETSLFGA